MSFERRKTRVGRVVSDKADKTAIVLVEGRTVHPIYRKAVKRRKRFVVHDPNNESRIGDQVRLIESKPLSKTKRWKIIEILKRKDLAEIQPDQIAIDETVVKGRDQVPSAENDQGIIDETENTEEIDKISEEESSQSETKPSQQEIQITATQEPESPNLGGQISSESSTEHAEGQGNGSPEDTESDADQGTKTSTS